MPHQSQRAAVALVGLSGAGKSSVGWRLAGRLGWPLRDTDALVVTTSERSIAQIFAEAGEAHFRALETAALQQALGSPPCVLATGGGIVLAPENRALLRERAFVVWLDAPTTTLITRLQAHDEPRPLLQGDNPLERLEALRAARAAFYTEVADLCVNTDERSIEEIVAQIAHQIEKGTLSP